MDKVRAPGQYPASPQPCVAINGGRAGRGDKWRTACSGTMNIAHASAGRTPRGAHDMWREALATQGMTIGDLKGFIDFAKQMVGGISFTSFDPLFDKIEELLRSFNQLTPEIEANLDLARQELNANPELFEIGKAEFIASVDALLAKYPASTLLSDIPEFQDGNGGGGGGNPTDPGGVITIGDIDIARIQKIFADVQVKYDSATKIVTVEGAGYSFRQADIERLEFNDGVLAFDFDGNAGKVYRLYQAVFGRDPDKDGLGYWIRHQDNKVSGFNAVADSFINSPEFVARFGTEQSVSNAKFVELLYTNTLGRNFDQEGYNYWLGKLDAGETNRRDLVSFFSESNENKTGTATEIADGIWYV